MRREFVLASSSPYRKQLLKRLGVPFETVSPFVDETPASGESASHLVKRLSASKAEAVSIIYPHAVIIGSDQTADLDGHLLGKPNTIEKACHQLSLCSGQLVTFHTGLCLISSDSRAYRSVETRVKFRKLTQEQILRYVEQEQPLNCAGSFKIENRGIALFEQVTSADPTALIGLPLIALTDMLLDIGCDPITAV